MIENENVEILNDDRWEMELEKYLEQIEEENKSQDNLGDYLSSLIAYYTFIKLKTFFVKGWIMDKKLLVILVVIVG